MRFCVTFSLVSALASANAAETILGAYIFHRHGDRTPKSLAPTNLTALGYEQVYKSGQYYRERYLTGSSKISGLNEDIAKLTQLSVTAPVDNVLQNSATAFLQALYPPVGSGESVQVLADGKKVQAPMDGYQLIPVNTIATNAGSEDNSWLQDSSVCANAKLSSNSYFSSAPYSVLLSSTKDFYTSLIPVVNATLSPSDVSYKNAYIVYDLINVATIHNASIPAANLLTNSSLRELRTLADAHEWNLAFNASDTVRAISGMQLAGEVLKYMNSTIAAGRAGSSANKFGIQFGAYATFLSFFGLAGLDGVSEDFMGLPDYASSMVFELFTDADVAAAGGGVPADDADLKVRFLFHNGTASNASAPSVYPLFGGDAEAIPWAQFHDGLSKFAVGSTEQWCHMCGNTTGSCAQFDEGGKGPSATGAGAGKGGMSAAVGGVIGAFVTLAVVLGLAGVVLLVGGFRLVRKRGAGRGAVVETTKV